MMDFTIRYGRDMTNEEFNTLLSLDIKIFGDTILTDEGMALKRFHKCKDSIISIFSEEMPVGFVCFFNVDKTIYQKGLMEQEIFDDNLSENEIMPMTKESGNFILIFDLVVDDKYRNQGISKLLFTLLGDYLKKKSKEGYDIERIFAYTMSPEGQRHSSFYGGRVIWSREEIAFVELDREAFIGTL